MKTPPIRGFLGLTSLLAVASAALAQNNPRIGYVYPAGGRQGASFQATVGGQFLNGVTNAHVSGSGVKAKVLEYSRPLTQREFTELKEKLQQLQQKRQALARGGARRANPAESPSSTNLAPGATWTAEDEKMLAEIRKKLMNPPIRQGGNPAIAETATIEVTLASDSEPGERELRLGTTLGLSNPLVFCVGQLPETTERKARVIQGPRANLAARMGAPARTTTVEPEVNIALPAIVNGQIMPGEVDRYRFKARRGQRMVVAASARQLIPYLPDAVPGWFQATLALYDASGREVAYDDDFLFNPDPVLYYEIPKEGEYVIEIKDSIYRGREDFVYRLTMGELPFVTSIFPLGGQAGTQTAVELRGWNLPVTTIKPEAGEPGIHALSVRRDEWTSNVAPFVVDTLPEAFETEPNNQPANPQSAALPLIVNGRIDPPGDSDVFRLEGRAGQVIVAEVSARRLNSPLDSVLKLTDAAGKQLAVNDDAEDKGAGLTTHHADSYLTATLPADGAYFVHLADAQHKGGPDYAYRLRLSPPRPDFALRVVPSSINARAGSTVPITVYALRKDGFSDEIVLNLKDAPPGFTLGGPRVPSNQDKVRITLAVPASLQSEPLKLNLEGRAKIQGRDVVRAAIPAEDMMQAFAYRHLVPAKELKVAMSGRAVARANLRILGETPVKIPAGGTARVRFAAGARAMAPQFQLELSEPPEGISLQNVAPSFGGTEIVLKCDSAKAKPGFKGNLIVNAFASGGRGGATNAKAPANLRRFPVGTLPAIPFEIVP